MLQAPSPVPVDADSLTTDSWPPQAAPPDAEEARPPGRKKRRWVRDGLAYGLAAAIIVFLARGTSLAQFESILRQANPWWFLLACAGSFAFWFFGETILYSKLFSYFHVRTSFREMLSANAAQYFLQAINQVAGGAALILFMRRRKGVPMFSGGATLIFLGLIDFLVMALMGLAAALLVPSSWLGPKWYYPAFLAAGICLVAWFWLRGRPSSALLRWIYDRPSLLSFRRARLSHYARLILIRAVIFAAQGFALYFQLRSFGVHVPLIQVLAFEPAELFLSALPITPAGLGVLQAVLILGFHSYGTRAAILTVGLAISTMGIMMRLPLGLGTAGAFAREAVRRPTPETLTAAAE
ncbi:MAG: lysylphosphatidylglycerol synthase transmembrane domain-containing protein [Terriglobia bacterium]